MALREPGETISIPMALQVVLPPDRAETPLERVKEVAQAGCKRVPLSDRVLLNSYIPPHGPTPPAEEVSAPRPKGAKEIIERWRPFHQGEAMADHLFDLYPTMLRIPVAVRVEGRGEEYSVPVPGGTKKEDLVQIVEDGMQVRNRNFTQSAKLVSL